MVDRLHDRPWTRKHDDPRRPLIREAPEIVFPSTLDDLLEICRRPQRFKAAGSHWALSDAAISDHTFIETHDPRSGRPGLNRTLHTAVPNCLHDDLLAQMRQPVLAGWFGTLAHVESGKKVCQLYAELDEVDELDDPWTLGGFMNTRFGVDHFAGPWGFQTLGGAGGQTVVGGVRWCGSFSPGPTTRMACTAWPPSPTCWK